mmetsp:Transcript_17525/g.48441  ORF Transcript_17525/g.48441 Transcript_17525/m.48441 type:complete len:360 (-) Transcript_17525:847-1926(-)
MPCCSRYTLLEEMATEKIVAKPSMDFKVQDAAADKAQSAHGAEGKTPEVAIEMTSLQGKEKPDQAKDAHSNQKFPLKLQVSLSQIQNISNIDDLFVSYPVKIEKAKLDSSDSEEHLSEKHKCTKSWDETFAVAIDDEKNPSSLTLQLMRKCTDFGIAASFSLDRSNGRSDVGQTLGHITIEREALLAMIGQGAGFETSIETTLLFNGAPFRESHGDPPAKIHLALQAIPDVTKHLKTFHPKVEINLPMDVEHMLETLSLKKAELPVWRWVFLGMLSGVWMAIAGIFAYSVAGSFDAALLARFPILPRLVLGLLAPVAMHFIVIFGGEFYSGNCMCATARPAAPPVANPGPPVTHLNVAS